MSQFRKAPWLLLACLALLLMGMGVFVILAPSLPIKVSKETTVITAPLGTDGLPRIARYLTESLAEGVTPENNAAVLTWPAIGREDLPRQDYVAICEAIGVELVPPDHASLVQIEDEQVTNDLGTWLVDDYEIGGDDSFDNAIDILVDQMASRPWSSEQVPPMARWIESNQKQLDMLLEASHRPKYFSPSPSFLRDEGSLVSLMLLPDLNGVRAGILALNMRAMWHLGEGRPMQAWDHVHAGFRYSRLLSQGSTVVHRLVGYAIDAISCQATNVILDSGLLTPEQARQILNDLNELPQRSSMIDSIDVWERLAFVDSVLAFARGDADCEQLTDGGTLKVPTLSVDWNYALRLGNEWYDRLVAAASIPDRDTRGAVLGALDSELMSITSSHPSVVVAFASRRRRSELMGNIMVQLFLPAVEAMVRATERTETLLQLTRTAAALALYRAENQSYPENLERLVPACLPAVPIDRYSKAPLIYKRRDDGYLLYSVGDNEIDDHGTDISGKIHQGEWLAPDELPPDGIDIDKHDLVVRMPHPSLVLPAKGDSEVEWHD